MKKISNVLFKICKVTRSALYWLLLLFWNIGIETTDYIKELSKIRIALIYPVRDNVLKEK